MSSSVVCASIIARCAAPLIKDLYDGAKGQVKKALVKWSVADFSSAIASRISDIESVRTIWSPEDNVSVRDFYYPCKISGVRGDVVPNETIAEPGAPCVVIQGIVGQGKSVFLRYLAVQEILKANNNRLPLFIELLKITKENCLKDVLVSGFRSYHIDVDDSVLEYLFSSGKVLLVLDGFDEIPNDLAIKAAIDIEGLMLRYPALQVIVSSRPGNEIQKLSSLKVLSIESLGKEDFEPFLKCLKVDTVKMVEIIDAIEKSPNDISGLITTPLMLTLVVLVYQAEKEIPPELPEFFERLFYTVFTRHDKLKPKFLRQHNSGLSERKLQMLFESFCFMSLQLGANRTLSPAVFQEAFELAQEYVNVGVCTEEGFRKDITKVSCLMLEEGWGECTFLHKSIAEYYAAAFVKNADDEFAVRFYKEAAENPRKWKECLDFLESIDQFRFAKYFAIPELEKFMPILEGMKQSQTPKMLLSTLPRLIKNARVKLEKACAETAMHDEVLEGEYQPVSIGPIGGSDGVYELKVGNRITGLIFASRSGIHENNLGELDGFFREVRWEKDLLSLSVAEYIFFAVEDKFRSQLAMLDTEFHLLLEKSYMLAKKMKKRVLVFDRKR